jgi:hypothetical protein
LISENRLVRFNLNLARCVDEIQREVTALERLPVNDSAINLIFSNPPRRPGRVASAERCGGRIHVPRDPPTLFW